MQAVAVILSVLGGLCELAGLGMVIREIGADRARARELLARDREYVPPRREYPSKIPVPSGRAGIASRSPVFGSRLDVHTLSAQMEKGMTMLMNAITGLTERIDKNRDELEVKLVEEIDEGDEELRQTFREVLESDLTERWIGVLALAVGIVLSATGSVLGSLN
jgi:hypothetical protein